MNRFKLVLFFLLTLTAGFANGVMFSQLKPEVVMPEVMMAFNQCLGEVEKGCPLLLGYAQSLEAENARLNRVVKLNLFKKQDCSCPETAP